MTQSDDLMYYRQRAATELRIATETTDPAARAAHLMLAEQYRRRAGDGGFNSVEPDRGPSR